MKTLFEDFKSPLPEVERVWLRRIGTILLTPIVVFAGLIFGICDALNGWYSDCW